MRTPSAGVSLVISDEVVLSPYARRTFRLLSAIVVGAMLAFGALWVLEPDWEHPVLYLLATMVLGYHLAIWLASWVTMERMRRPTYVAPVAGLRVATATTFVPGAEPLEMLEQTLRAMVQMDYPHDTFVLDESDDPGVRALCERLGATHFTRRHRAEYREPSGPFAVGTKYGNYNSWLDEIAYERYDVIGTFDPDHVPERHYLTRTLGYFNDPQVGYVQAPQVYYNQDASFIARGAAEESYRYYSSLQMSNYAFGEPVVTGSHTLHRTSALQSVGGFPAHDAEDLYITLLYGASEWRGVYVPEILALGITPVDWRGYLGQQTRWARSLLDLKIRVYPKLASRLSATERLLGFSHGAYYLRSLTYPVVYLLVAYMLVAGVDARFASGRMLLALTCLTLVLHLAERFSQYYFLDRRRETGLHWRAILLQFAKWPWFVRAAWEALRGTRPAYLLTPKVAEPPRRGIVARPHLAIAAVLAAAWAVSVALHGPPPPVLQLATAVLIALSLGIAATEWREYPPPFEPDRYAARRTALEDLLPPAHASRP